MGHKFGTYNRIRHSRRRDNSLTFTGRTDVSSFCATNIAIGCPHPVVGPQSWFAMYHLGHAACFEATGEQCKPWLCAEHWRGCWVLRGHSGELSIFYCQSLASRWDRLFITHMFWWSRPGTKRRQRAVVLALVHCGRNARIWLFRIIYGLSPVLDMIGLRSTYL